MTQRLLPLKDVLERTGMSRSYIYTHMRRGDFPRPVTIGARASRWEEPAIAAWLARWKLHNSNGGGS